ncbi:MAG: hypothetical protein Q9201_000530 [Fulgogasparrea decipioides]
MKGSGTTTSSSQIDDTVKASVELPPIAEQASSPILGVKVSSCPLLDFIDNYPCVVSKDVHYRLLIKRNLAFPGLPTPHIEFIEGALSPTEVRDDKALETEAQRITRVGRDHDPAFVIEFPQSLAGKGIFVV